MNRFAILEHRAAESVHWDIMLETGDILRTWQLERNPCRPNTRWPIPSKPIFDHRKRYLRYEGPVSGNRGNVTRVDRGTYKIISQDERLLRITLAGEIICGDFSITSSEIRPAAPKNDYPKP